MSEETESNRWRKKYHAARREVRRMNAALQRANEKTRADHNRALLRATEFHSYRETAGVGFEALKKERDGWAAMAGDYAAQIELLARERDRARRALGMACRIVSLAQQVAEHHGWSDQADAITELRAGFRALKLREREWAAESEAAKLSDASPEPTMRPCESCVLGGDPRDQLCEYRDDTGVKPGWLCADCYRDAKAAP